ncbi:MAG TPA: FAD-dependent oxidoreductase [Vicinamibacterales bacterium]|jgi:glycine/D-amino acid oxidase-like deaminating enzyme|nr:FAD-dependent oxidoreductase [Vicinamibacterales bacterium]
MMRALSCSALGVPPWDPVVLPPRASLPESADVVIVGGGLTGLLVATAMARPWRDVVVIEQAFGSGATARSGGVVLGDTSAGPALDFMGCEESFRQWIGAHAVHCDLQWHGCLELARNSALPSAPVDWHDQGSIRLVRRVNGGVLDPAKLLGAVMAIAYQAGAKLVNRVSVHNVVPGRSGIIVRTNDGTIAARKVVMATDAMLAPTEPRRDPWEERALTVAIQTDPVSASVIARLGLEANLPFYTDDMPLLWGRVMPDLSLLIGRELVPGGFDTPAELMSAIVSSAGALLLDRARRLHPALADVVLKRAWGGPIASTKTGTPAVLADHTIPGVTWAGGYGGQGIAQSFRVAQLVAESIELPSA